MPLDFIPRSRSCNGTECSLTHVRADDLEEVVELQADDSAALPGGTKARGPDSRRILGVGKLDTTYLSMGGQTAKAVTHLWRSYRQHLTMTETAERAADFGVL